MYEQKELKGKLFDSEVVRLILNLKEINEKHTIGSKSIDYLGKTYDAQTVNQLLRALEDIAIENNLEVRRLTADSSLDELLGISETKEIEVITTLECWNLINSVADKTSN